jgi:hypothetical protein
MAKLDESYAAQAEVTTCHTCALSTLREFGDLEHSYHKPERRTGVCNRSGTPTLSKRYSTVRYASINRQWRIYESGSGNKLIYWYSSEKEGEGVSATEDLMLNLLHWPMFSKVSYVCTERMQPGKIRFYSPPGKKR